MGVVFAVIGIILLVLWMLSPLATRRTMRRKGYSKGTASVVQAGGTPGYIISRLLPRRKEK